MALVANSKASPIILGHLIPHALQPWSRVSYNSHEEIRHKSNDTIVVGDLIPHKAHGDKLTSRPAPWSNRSFQAAQKRVVSFGNGSHDY